jgi:hypothetical protein
MRMRLREQLPKSEISPITCAGLTCSAKVRFGASDANIVVTMGANERPSAIAAVMAAPGYASDAEVRQSLATTFSACSVAVLSLTSPEMAPKERARFAVRVSEAGGVGLPQGAWTFTSGNSSKINWFRATRP